jgi:hypothetical protein
MTQPKYDELSNVHDVNELSRRINNLISNCPKDDPIFLSDAILQIRSGNNNGAQEVFIALEANEKAGSWDNKPMTWKILVIRDEWNNIPNPGEKVVKVNKKPFVQADGKPYPPNYLNTAIATGRYAEEFETRKEYIVDEKGCIECPFTDAVHFLNLWGIHPRGGHQITLKPELSSEPVRFIDDGSEDGQKLHVWYHRYMEMTKESYAKLPPRKPSKEPKREKKAS